MRSSKWQAALLIAVLPVWAQEAAPTREAEILEERRAKAKTLAPELNPPAERRVIAFRENRILERLTSGVGGLRVKLGGLATNGGFAVGPEYARDDLAGGRVQFRTAAQVSFRSFEKYDVDLSLPRLANNRAFLNLYAVRHNYPELQYYGPGPNSKKTGRSNYRLEDTAFDGTFGVRPIRWLTLAGQAGYVLNNVGPGTREDFISTDRQFSPAQTIGIDRQANFLRYGGYAQIDYRDTPFGTRRGGQYYFQFSRYQDRSLGRHDHNRMDVELQQYIPFFNERRIIALRAHSTITDTRAGQTVPFYMQPILGGSETLRGYRPYRFYGNNSLLLNAEYRFEVFSGLDMALFADAGKVVPRPSLLDLSKLESSVGFGFRFNVRNNVFLRVDTGFSQEGFQVWLKFNKIFFIGPTRTSSSQGEF